MYEIKTRNADASYCTGREYAIQNEMYERAVKYSPQMHGSIKNKMVRRVSYECEGCHQQISH